MQVRLALRGTWHGTRSEGRGVGYSVGRREGRPVCGSLSGASWHSLPRRPSTLRMLQPQADNPRRGALGSALD